MNTNRTLILTLSVLLLFLYACHAKAQNAAPSSHLVFDDRFEGDIIINEVRVPESGKAMYTYYETLGWGGKGSGYAGIQAHPRGNNYIFSIWDNKSHSAPIRAVHLGPGTETESFGGEGTGLKSWNFELGWETDVWYTLVARNWPVDDHTYFGFWVRNGKTSQWTHMVTMDVAVAGAKFQGSTDAFIEDWLDTGKNPRTTNLREGWKHKADGSWFPFGSGRYSVNAWDLVPGKRSYNYRENWDGGVASDGTGNYYYMISGGAQTQSTTENPSTHEIKRTEKKPDFELIKIDEMKLTGTGSETLQVSWVIAPDAAPQFGYEINVYDNKAGTGEPVIRLQDNMPHARQASIDISKLEPAQKSYYAHLRCRDIFDRLSAPKLLKLDTVN